jgi:hypothetical protein
MKILPLIRRETISIQSNIRVDLTADEYAALKKADALRKEIADIEAAIDQRVRTSNEYVYANRVHGPKGGVTAIKVVMPAPAAPYVNLHVHTSAEQVTEVTRPLAMDVSTLNALLHSKLLSDRQKRSMLFAVNPGLAEALTEPDEAPSPATEGVDLPPPEGPDFLCPDGFFYDWQKHRYFPLPLPQTPPTT